MMRDFEALRRAFEMVAETSWFGDRGDEPDDRLRRWTSQFCAKSISRLHRVAPWVHGEGTNQ
jgi:hypothetical protein